MIANVDLTFCWVRKALFLKKMKTGPLLLFISGSTCERIPTVAFMAQLSSNVVDPSKGSAVIFHQVETNTGGAYNGSRGVFMAPFNGTYNFNLVVSSPESTPPHWLHLFIVRNDVEVDYLFLDHNDRYYLRRSTGMCIINLTRGDKIWVKVDEVTRNRTITGCCFHSLFSGFLIGTN